MPTERDALLAKIEGVKRSYRDHKDCVREYAERVDNPRP